MEIFRAYDIRGEYPKDINNETVYSIARILAKKFSAKKAVIGHDASLATPNIHKALIEGLLDQGVDVTDIGLAGTDVVYFSAGNFKFDLGLEVTASHSAGHLSGVKIVGPSVKPVSKGSGMEELKESFLNYKNESVGSRGSLVKKEVMGDFISRALAFVDVKKINRPLTIVADASNAVGGLEIDELEKHLPSVKFVKINWEPDGRYPGHKPDPFLKENRQQLVNKVKETGADLGIAFDGDADRIYFIDENGDYVFGAYIIGLIAEKMCKKEPGRVVLHDIRASRFVKKKVVESGGIPKIELVGHAYFKNRMRKENALFGGESSGHIYYNFGDFMAENSIIALVQILQIMSETGKNLGELTREGRLNYPVSGEYNFVLPGSNTLEDLTPDAIERMNKVLDRVREKYSDGEISDFDTLTISYPDWNFNLRPSANDPVLRFTAEATSNELLLKKQEEVFDLLKNEGCQFLNDSGVVLLR